MLKHLQVTNLALVEKAVLDFGPGFNVITGETGAGKSLLAGAFNLALGERADKSIVRAGAGQCTVEAAFHLDDTQAIDALLTERGVESCAGGELVLRRSIAAAAAGRQFINDSPVTLQTLKSVGDRLADMHGPHAHQSLLDTAAQQDMLDDYGDLRELRAEYARVYREYDDLRRQKQELEKMPVDGALEEWLASQVAELTAADLRVAEEAELLAELKLQGNAQRVLELTAELGRCLMDGDDSVLNALAAARKSLTSLQALADIPSGWTEQMESVQAQVRETAREIESLAQRVDCDPARLAGVEERLALYQKLKHKYGGTVEAVQCKLESVRAELDAISDRKNILAELDTRMAETHGVVLKAGTELSAARRRAADNLQKMVGRELRELDMVHAKFAVCLERTEPGSSGMDAVEFEFSANVGESPRNLRDVASSGEMSRVMLALKSALADQDRVPVLFFDEIDVNLGGRAAGVVGAKMRALARRRQILCITHLPQVASCADSHFVVSKTTIRKRTVTLVAELDKESKVREIARMLGGDEDSEVALAHAAEMLQR